MKTVVVGQDTFALVPIPWIKNGNAVKIFADECKQLADTLLKQTKDLKSVNDTCKAISDEKQDIIAEQVDIINQCITEKSECDKRNDKLKKRNRILIGTSVALFILVLI